MNKKRRTSLETALFRIRQAIEIVEEVRDEESDSMDNIPENLQSTERYTSMEDAIDSLEDAISSLEDATESINKAINGNES